MNSASAFLAFGSNLACRGLKPAETIRAALIEVGRSEIEIECTSRLYASPAWPNPADPPFVNAVAGIRTNLPPEQLLRQLQAVERAFGRVASKRNAPRTLDLDILDYDGRIEQGQPVLPHPRMHSRAFVLVPLAEIAPLWRHPVLGATAKELVEVLTAGDRETVIPITPWHSGG